LVAKHKLVSNKAADNALNGLVKLRTPFDSVGLKLTVDHVLLCREGVLIGRLRLDVKTMKPGLPTECAKVATFR
jgi:hypothetical protein